MAKIGFIGLGHLGLPMAKNLLKAGHEIKAYDPSEDALSAAQEAGIDSAKNIAEGARDVDVVISLVPSGNRSREVYLKEDGILKNAKPGALLIDCSTTFEATNHEIQFAAEKAGFQIVDAPVSGGVDHAETGTLTFMVAGNDKAFLEAEPILGPMASEVFHFRPTGRHAQNEIEEDTREVIYKKQSPWWRRSTVVLIFLFLGGNAVFFALIEDSIKMNGDRLTVSLELGPTERNLFCRGLGMIGLDIDGC